MAGWFFTFEGIDGSGKTTVSRRLARTLRDDRSVTWTKEPTDSWLGGAVERAVAEERTAAATAFLFMADRIEHTLTIREQLAADTVVLCDRYLDSTIAYQAVRLEERDDPVRWLRDLHRSFAVTPDLTFLFMLDPEVALRRIDDRTLSPFERSAFLGQVQDNYRRLARMENRFVVLDATLSPDELHRQCMDRIAETMTSGRRRR